MKCMVPDGPPCDKHGKRSLPTTSVESPILFHDHAIPLGVNSTRDLNALMTSRPRATRT